MYNRYQGNTGRVERVDDGSHHPSRGPMQPPSQRGSTQQPPQRGSMPPQDHGPHPMSPLNAAKSSIFNMLDGILPNKLQGLETEDLMLLLILYLMYRESGDKEMLIIMGAMFLL
jgi:hypothetical protein